VASHSQGERYYLPSLSVATREAMEDQGVPVGVIAKKAFIPPTTTNSSMNPASATTESMVVMDRSLF
jgi:hypothetical protein